MILPRVEVVWRQLDHDLVSPEYLYVVHPHLPDTWANTLWPLGSLNSEHRGNGSTTVPSISIPSPFGILPLGPAQYNGSVAGHGHRVFKMSRQASVLRGRCPTVLLDIHFTLSHVHHRFYGKYHSSLEPETRSFVPVPGHLRFFMQAPSYSVTDKTPLRRRTSPLDTLLNGVGDIIEPVASRASSMPR